MKVTIYNKLRKYEQQLQSMLLTNYCRLSMQDMEDTIIPAYTAITGNAVSKAERACTHCKIKVIKAVASAYFEQKAKNSNSKSKSTDNK